MRLLVLSALVAGAHAHGSMIMPLARNSIDAEDPAWSNGKHPMTGTIEPYNCRCTNGTDVCNNGQSCFWFSNGCTPGCKACDGNGNRYPNFDHVRARRVRQSGSAVLGRAWLSSTSTN